MKFTIYNKDGVILRVGDARPNMVSAQVQEGEYILKGVHANAKIHKIIDGQITEKTIEELKEETFKKPFNFRRLNKSMTDAGIITEIKKVYGDDLDIKEFVEKHYDRLRTIFYPNTIEYIDAQIKLSSTDKKTQKIGQKQLDKYLADCLAVKARFPKPTV